MSWSSRKEDRRDICTLVKENQGNNLVTPRNHWNETFYLYFFYICVSERIIFFNWNIFPSCVMPRLSWGDSRRGIFTWMCWKHYLFHYALLCHITFVFTFLCFFRYSCYIQFSSLPGFSILGRAIVAIAGSGLILIRLTVVYYILFCATIFLSLARRN